MGSFLNMPEKLYKYLIAKLRGRISTAGFYAMRRRGFDRQFMGLWAFGYAHKHPFPAPDRPAIFSKIQHCFKEQRMIRAVVYHTRFIAGNKP